MTDKSEKKIAELEALLFVHGEPVAIQKISTALGISYEETMLLLESYREMLRDDKRGLMIVFARGGKQAQLVTKPEFSHVLERFVKDELREDLTPASLETLSLVAYLGPVSKNKIEYIRGVNSSFIIRTLLLRGLIERVSDQYSGRTMQYAPSMECLRYLGVNAQSELPDFERFRASIITTEKEEETKELESSSEIQEP